MALIGSDGIVRARRVGTRDSLGQDIGASQVFAAMRRGAGSAVLPGPIDGRPRFYSYMPLPGLPLYALVGLDCEERLADFETRRRTTLALAGLSGALVLGFTAILSGLTRRLIASREAARAASLAKSRFLSNMSHELRAPLNGVLGYAELRREELHGQAGNFALRIHECGMRLLGLVEAVLELSGLEAGQTALALRQERLGELAQCALAGQRAAARDKALVLRLELGPQLPRHYVCDRGKLLRLLDILLDNAVQASSTGEIRLQVRSAPGRLLFRVCDQGPGLPAAVRSCLFEHFASADDSPSRPRGGAGLGLAIAARLAQLMGGTLRLDDAADAGTAFCVSLPFLRLQDPAGAIIQSEEAAS
ncbi:sensor histidine kinase [Duganella callida]|uniref:histidine kinase n=1 Tax=Duganella callida TaxID=2561932 RepID=A0A4Y9T1J3_9BURK|nr:ATP-binding protein [Duganella callida]TFW31378.1 hypothetical protein E4L98_00345 [Duganella callida]